jgi:hypothetical protein
MRRFRKAALPLLLAGALAIGWGLASVSASTPPETAGKPAGTAPSRATADPYFRSGPLAAVGTYLSRGYNAQALTSMFAPVEPRVKVKCAGKTGRCVVAADINVAISSTNSDIELCPYVDGSAAKSQLSCYANVGTSSTSSGYHSYSFVHTFTISHGSHKVQTHALVTSGSGSMSFFSNTYTVYRPTG